MCGSSNSEWQAVIKKNALMYDIRETQHIEEPAAEGETAPAESTTAAVETAPAESTTPAPAAESAEAAAPVSETPVTESAETTEAPVAETAPEPTAEATPEPAAEITPAPEAETTTSTTTPTPAATESQPKQRVIEARSTDDSMSSMVRCLYFADTFIVNGKWWKHMVWCLVCKVWLNVGGGLD